MIRVTKRRVSARRRRVGSLQSGAGPGPPPPGWDEPWVPSRLILGPWTQYAVGPRRVRADAMLAGDGQGEAGRDEG